MNATNYSHEILNSLHRANVKEIKLANKNLEHPVRIIGWSIRIGQVTSLVTDYYDGANIRQSHSIVL